MPRDTLPLRPASAGLTPGDSAEAPRDPAVDERTASPPAVPLSERWLLAAADLAQLLGLSVRQVRRLDATGDLPGRLTGGALGRAVRWRVEVVKEWVEAGCPGAAGWERLQRSKRVK
jgi:predicted DNA-binding transcriptional regulator AlpA